MVFTQRLFRTAIVVLVATLYKTIHINGVNMLYVMQQACEGIYTEHTLLSNVVQVVTYTLSDTPIETCVLNSGVLLCMI